MPPGELVVQGLLPGVLPTVVTLHGQTLPYSLNSRLGPGHLARLYTAMERDPDCCVMVALLSGEVAGVVSVALNPDQFIHKFTSQLRPGQWAALAGQLALHPALILDWRESRELSQPLQFQGQVVQACLSAIAVAARHRRAGVGKALVESVEAWMRARNQAAYYLDTLAENQPARAFYARLGFMETEQRGKSIMLVKGI